MLGCGYPTSIEVGKIFFLDIRLLREDVVPRCLGIGTVHPPDFQGEMPCSTRICGI